MEASVHLERWAQRRGGGVVEGGRHQASPVWVYRLQRAVLGVARREDEEKGCCFCRARKAWPGHGKRAFVLLLPLLLLLGTVTGHTGEIAVARTLLQMHFAVDTTLVSMPRIHFHDFLLRRQARAVMEQAVQPAVRR